MHNSFTSKARAFKFFFHPRLSAFIVLLCAFIAFLIAIAVPLPSTSSRAVTSFASEQSDRNEISVEEMKLRRPLASPSLEGKLLSLLKRKAPEL